jgi:hypothetical protein
MGANGEPRTLLSSVSEVVGDMSEADLLEAAAFGSLVDWELVKFLARLGWSLSSLSFRFQEDEVLLVAKVLVDKAPYVVFVTSSSPTGCIRAFVRKASSSSLALYPDRYA